MRTNINHLPIHYETAGKGQAVLLLHGWGDDLSAMKQLSDSLSKVYKVISIDLPGFGESGAPITTWDLDDYAEFVKEFLEQMKIDELYAIIGHSNGASIAIRGLSSGKLAAKKLVVLAASGIKTAATFKSHILRAVGKVGSLATKALPKKAKKGLRTKFYKKAKGHYEDIKTTTDQLKTKVLQDIRLDAKKIDMPTLLIYGQDDVDTPPAFGQLFYRLIVGSDLKLIKGAGHYVQKDAPEEVAADINEFLA